jgi:hypothetical protein
VTGLIGWVDEVQPFLGFVPGPKRGGTWLYCCHQEPVRGGVTCCLFRTRRWKTYWRHWRRQHR